MIIDNTRLPLNMGHYDPNYNFIILININNSHYESVGELYQNDDKEYIIQRIFSIDEEVIRKALKYLNK